jgi:hypothetical protein
MPFLMICNCDLRFYSLLKIKYKKINHLARCWWLMPIILATWEAKIGRITVQDGLGKN